jgi:hypothetical protein
MEKLLQFKFDARVPSAPRQSMAIQRAWSVSDRSSATAFNRRMIR